MTDKNYIALFEKYLRGESTAEETERLIDLVGSENKFRKIWENELMDSDPTLDETVKKRIFEKIRRETAGRRSYSLSVNWRKTVRWAAVILLPVLSAFTVYYFAQYPQRDHQPTVITAQKGEKAEVVLPDGSISTEKNALYICREKPTLKYRKIKNAPLSSIQNT